MCLITFHKLYRANVLDYISYMKTIKRYSPKSVNNHLSSLRSFNEFLIFSGRQTELAIVKNDFMKIQTQYANPCTVEQKDVEAFRQRLLEGGNKRDFAIVTLYTFVRRFYMHARLSGLAIFIYGWVAFCLYCGKEVIPMF